MSFEEIWLAYRANVKAFLHSRVSDADEVDDLLQAVMIKIYEKHHTLRSQSSVKAWLFQTANNTIIDHYRKSNKARLAEAYGPFFQDSNSEEMLDLENCVAPFIQALPAEPAKLLTDIDINGRSQKEYAAGLGISYSTLKSRVQKARSDLRKLFEECCHFSLDAHGNILSYEKKKGKCSNC